MSNGLNKVMLLGNLGAEPELRHTQGGGAVLKLRLATTETWLDKGGQRQERTEWHSVTVWGKRGEALAKILSKGSNIFVEGSLRTSSYEKNGEKRYTTEVNASNILLTGKRGESGAHGGRAPQAQQSRSAPQQADDTFESDYDDGSVPF